MNIIMAHNGCIVFKDKTFVYPHQGSEIHLIIFYF